MRFKKSTKGEQQGCIEPFLGQEEIYQMTTENSTDPEAYKLAPGTSTSQSAIQMSKEKKPREKKKESS
ncbi:MAG: hypothetical protein VB778_03580 [Nitrospinaceae bacterium]